MRLLALGLALVGCLEDPVLTPCADFPAGTSGCPDRREVYCELVTENCPEAYADFMSCQAAATEFVSGEVGETVGNTIECRIEHAQLAADDPQLCDAAGESGGLACIATECFELCDLVGERCENAYPQREHCLYMCRNYDRGSDLDGKNTLECRLRHAREGKCDAAHTNGGGVCGEPCEMYCKLAQQNCSADDVALYRNERKCLSACELLVGDGAFTDWQFDIEGDTVQCRTYHLGLPAAEFPGKHCPHAGVFNEVHCGKNVCSVYCDIVARECETDVDPGRCENFCSSLGDVVLESRAVVPCDMLR